MYGSHKKHSAGARNVKARAKRALLLPSTIINRQLKEIGLSLGDPRIEEIAQDRKQWRFLTNGGGAVPTNGGNA